MKTIAKWSIKDYHHMIEAGILQNRQVELLEGEIIEMSPETPFHYNSVKRGVKYLEKLLEDKADVRFNGPITLPDSEPEPDVAIVKLPESSYDNLHPYPEDIYWLIEVANTSLKQDLEIKKTIYAQANIQEYWIMILQTQQLIVFRAPKGKKYLSETTFTAGSISPLAFPEIKVLLEHLF
jgi:Uma2 family endonuclease